jgi:uncharacterized membrane protein
VGSASGINDAGAIVGEDEQARAAVVWPSATAKPFRLPVPAGARGATAADIDEDGTTVGTIDDRQPYVWFPGGTHRELPMPDLGGGPAVEARAFTVRNGWATGVATGAAGQDGTRTDQGTGEEVKVAAVRWNVRTGEVQVTEDLQIRASTANAHGWQVGTDKQGRAVLIADDRTVVLPDLAGHEAGGLANIANTLSDDGRTIGGQSDDATGTIQAVVWRCE